MNREELKRLVAERRGELPKKKAPQLPKPKEEEKNGFWSKIKRKNS